MSEYIVDFKNAERVSHFESLFADFTAPIHEEIVRCRDCKHYELQTVVYSSKPLSVCMAEWCEGSEHDNPLVEPNGYCKWGERRER